MKKLWLIVCFGILVACDSGISIEIKSVDYKHLPIERILDEATDYAGQEVLVKGRTSDTTKTPFGSMYKLTDASGSIWVQTTQAIPKEHSIISLTAKVENVFSFRESALGLHLVEISRELP